MIDLVHRLVIQGTAASVCSHCLNRVGVIVLRGCGADRSNVRGGGDLLGRLVTAVPHAVVLDLYYPLLTLYLLCILHVIVRCLFIVVVCIVEGQRPVHLIPHLHCWLALILLLILISIHCILLGPSSIYFVALLIYVQRIILFTRDNATRPIPSQ